MLFQEIRPKTFDAFYGNKAIVSSLKKFIKQTPDKRPHTFLFSGSTGTGKTTLAKILANEFGCSNIDLEELNAANLRGIDTVRSVTDRAFLMPMAGKCRVFIFDEAHQITRDGQNALLKIIEDVPQHTYFIFCSTDPQKIIKTIQNRCIQFYLEKLHDKDMIDLIEDALVFLKVDISDEVFDNLIYCADGCPRLALTMLEQLVSISDEKEQLEILKKAQIESEIKDLCQALLYGKKNWSEIVDIYKSLPETEPETIRRAIIGYMKSVALSCNVNSAKAIEIIAVFENNLYDSGEAGLVRMLYDV